MATSGTSVFDATRDEIITSALRKIAVLGEGETPSAAQLTNGAFMLNTLIKEAHADGMPLWAIETTPIACSLFVNGVVSIGVGATINVPQPLKVLSAFVRDNSQPTQPTDIPLTVLTRDDYNWLSSKFSQGTPVQYYHEPLNGYSRLYLWPRPDTYSNLYRQIYITYQRPFQDAGNGSNNLDFPTYWINALIYQLAWRLSPEYGVPPNDRQILAKEATVFWERALSFGTEEGSIRIAPDWSRMHMGQGGNW